MPLKDGSNVSQFCGELWVLLADVKIVLLKKN